VSKLRLLVRAAATYGILSLSPAARTQRKARAMPEGVPVFALSARNARCRRPLMISLIAILAAGVFALSAAALFVWSGLYNIGATSGHTSLTRYVLHFAMKQSVKTHAPDLPVPSLEDPKLVKLGAAHYQTGCAPCHGSPDFRASPIEIGATPPPPLLYSAALDFTPSQLHWIIKNGIKMTAMPPWPTQDRDDEIWALVAFLNALPFIKPGEYAPLVGLEAGPASSGDGASFQQLAVPPAAQGCSVCHGIKGKGDVAAAPALAGLSAAYIREQLTLFREGSRPSGMMQPIAVGLPAKANGELAEYFSSQQRTKAEGAAGPGGAELGEKIARQGAGIGVPACNTCHSGASDLAPPLQGQSAQYLALQLRLFRSEVRQGPRSDAMRAIAKRLSVAEAEAVSAYFASPSELPGKP
jgi:cytochrome c553